jgi:hypothetical protein
MTIGAEIRTRAENDFRYEWLEKMNVAPKQTKNTNHKITNAIIEEIKTNILTAKNIGLIELISFCVFYNKHITIITDKIMLEIIPDDSCAAPEILRYNPATKKYKIVDAAPAAPPPRVVVEQYNKPMVGISNYSVEKLKEMAAQLCLDATAARTKKELYDLIYVAISTELPPARGD